MRYIFSLFIVLWSMMTWGQEGGFNPSNPQEPGQMYFLTINVNPNGAGGTSPSGKNQYALGQKIDLRAHTNTNYRFVGWKQEGSTVSDKPSFSFTIPAKHIVLTALFEYQPNNPNEPSPVPLQHKLFLNASPTEGGRFNITSGTPFKEGETINLQAYLNTGYEFEGWKQGDTIVSTGGSYSLTMGTEDISLTGTFRFNPANPSNPGSNHWNAKTGEVIMDDFKPGSIMSAIDEVIEGSGNRDKVTMVIVSGQMNGYDFGIADYLTNCTLLDLSRTNGCVEIPDYAFDYTNLSSIILPASVEHIGYRTFADCKNLTNISCYAVTPPSLRSNAFTGVNESIVLHVLSSSISLYSEAEGWKDFTILPLTEEVRALEVNLPTGSEGLYKNMTLELMNAETGQKQRYVISDRLSYTFNGLLKNCTYNVYVKTPTGTVLGQIKDIEIKDENRSVTFNSLLALLNINLKVLTPDGTDITDQVQITWLDAQQAYLSQGNQLKGQTATTVLNYRMILNQTLGMQYVFPENQTYTVQEKDNQLVYTLAPIKTLTITGLVKDINGGGLSGAVVSISQKLNKKYSKSFIAQTDTKGKFELQVYNDESTISVSATDFISQTLAKDNFGEETDLGTIALKSVTGATINLSFTYTTSVAEGEAVNTQSWYSDYANVAYSIYNVTKSKAIAEYTVQHPSIVLLEEVAEGDQLRITASSKNNTFIPVESTATIDAFNKVTATFNIIELGGINASYRATSNVGVVGILYDSKKELVKKYTYSSSSLSIANLPDGAYTLVSMANSTFFNSILKLSQLTTSGLTEGTDYVQNQITVKSGVIAKIVNDNIPALDESKLYYTGNTTAFTVNKASIVAGNYLTLKGKIDFKSEYSSGVSDVRMIVDLPESCSFVDNSVMVGSKVSGYTLDGNRLTIPLSNYADQIRFCIIPTEGGTYSPNAFVEFSLGGKTTLQPIGSAYYEVKDLTISVPKTVAKATLPISGTALGNSAIAIYDNNVLIGQTTSLANGVWSTTCDLNNPYNLSTHSIYAKVTTKQGLELQSETQEVMYDMNAIQVSTVAMNFYNGWLKSNIEVVFDLLNGMTNASSYMFYTTTDITFIIDFTKNNPDVISNVTIYVFTDQNEVRALKATYDKKKDRWIAVSEFGSNNLPINVSVDFDAKTTSMLDSSLLDEIYSSVNRIVEDAHDSKKFLDDLKNKINIEIGKDKPDYKIIDELLGQYLIKSSNVDHAIVDSLSNLEDEQFFLSVDDICEQMDSLIEDATLYSDEAENSILQYSLYGEETFVTGEGIHVNRIISNCKGVDKEMLIADDYTMLLTTDGGIIYEKSTEKMYCLVDFIHDVRFFIQFSDISSNKVTMGVKKYSDWLETIRIAYFEFSKVLATNSDLYMQVFKEHNKNAAKKIKKLLDKDKILQEAELAVNKKLENAFGLKEIELKAAKMKIQKQRNFLKKEIDRVSKLSRWLSHITKAALSIYDWKQWHDRVMEMAQALDKLEVPYCAYEANPTAAALIDQYVNDARKEFKNYYLAQFGRKAVYNIADLALGPVIGLAMAILQEKAESVRDKQFENSMKGDINRYEKWIKQLKKKCKDEPNDNDDGNNDRPNPTTPPVPPIHDPSGYVYESVESNRLQGATATCYYREMVEDMYGDIHENIVLWDAAEYAQKNPLFTDGMGMYAWDVPQGLWQVKFEKEGYQTTYSEWLPVPPPQLEVNIGMTQTTQPTVDAVRGYETGIEVGFSKFMQPATLTTEQVMVTRNGKVTPGEVKLLNEETAPSDANQKFASKVRFVPVEPFSTTDKVVLTISKRVKSYAGIGMENDYSQEIDIMKEAKSIVASDIEVVYNKTAEITVAVDPAEASAGKKITVSSASPMIATITPSEAILDKEGKATFTVTGELLGRTMLQFSIEGMNLKSEVKVSVVAAEKENVSRSYRLSMGWNWLSVNVNDPNLNDVKALLEPIKESIVTIKGQSDELTNDDQNGLQGSLTIWHPQQAYKIKMKKDATLELKGKPIVTASTTITLNKGWNWIGYVPVGKVSLESALQNLVAEENDIIKGLDCFAVYNGTAWVGSLTHLTPGEGYMYYSQSVKSFNYLESEAGTNMQSTPTQWEYNTHQYADNMTVLARLYNGEQQVQVDTYLIGAFVGNECRGVAVEKDGYMFLTIHGEQIDEQVSLRAFDIASEKEYTINEGLKFSETMKGSYASPISLHLGELTGINSIIKGLFVYPSPVRDRLYVRGDFDDIENIYIVNSTGQTGILTDKLSAKEGIDVTSLTEGIYFITVKIGKEIIQQKFIKIK